MKSKLFLSFAMILSLLFIDSKSVFAHSNEVLGDDSPIVKITGQSYDTETAKGIVLVDFWAPWCPPCRKMNPVLEAFAKENKDILKVGKVNVDENQDLSTKMGISSIPVIIIYKDGKEVDRVVGFTPQDQLDKIVKKYTNAEKK